MCNWPRTSILVLIGLVALSSYTHVAAREAGYYGLGQIATAEEIAGWDIDVRPDGLGLPPGSGSVVDGEPLYEEKCASCHGLFGEGEGRWPKIAGGYDTLTEDRPEKTVGSYWPYASTLWDYIHRAMPFTAPQSLSDDETYAITAYVLYLNDIVDEGFVLAQENFAELQMPNKDGFFIDPRPDIKNTLCMENCKDPKTLRISSAIKGVTPMQHLQKNQASPVPASVDTQATAHPQGEMIYQISCALCHAQGVAGAPKTGDKAMWEIRMEKGADVLIKNAVEGYTGDAGIMPAKGGNSSLGDGEVAAAVMYMLDQSR